MRDWFQTQQTSIVWVVFDIVQKCDYLKKTYTHSYGSIMEPYLCKQSPVYTLSAIASYPLIALFYLPGNVESLRHKPWWHDSKWITLECIGRPRGLKTKCRHGTRGTRESKYWKMTALCFINFNVIITYIGFLLWHMNIATYTCSLHLLL